MNGLDGGLALIGQMACLIDHGLMINSEHVFLFFTGEVIESEL